MEYEELKRITEHYLAQFHSRVQACSEDDFAIKAFHVLSIFLDNMKPLTQDTRLINNVYTHLGFHYWFNYFNDITISPTNLASYILTRQFILTVQSYNLNTEMTTLFHRFNKEALTPALNQYSPPLDTLTKTQLTAIYDGLMASFSALISHRIDKFEIQKARLVEQANEEGFSFELLKKGLGTGRDLIVENYDCLQITWFMAQYDCLLHKENVTARDLMSLKNEAIKAQKSLPQIPEMNEVTQYSWLINLLCTFINKYIYTFFESQNKKSINTFFAQWDSMQEEGNRIQNNYATSII